MSLPYFPMFPSDFEAKTSHLTLAEDGAYNRLLRICWMTPGCTIPNDEDWIMRRVRAHSDADKEAVRAILSEFFTVKNGRLSNARLMRVWTEANDAHEKRKNAGYKGGKAKALNRNKNASSNAKAMLKQPEPEPEPEPDISNTSKEVYVIQSDEIAEAVSAYNDAADRSGWPKVQKVTPARRSSLKARLKDAGGIEGWNIAISKAEASDFLCARTPQGFTASFDFLTRQSSFAKLMEGNYDNRTNNANRPSTGSGTVDAFAAVAARLERGTSAGNG